MDRSVERLPGLCIPAVNKAVGQLLVALAHQADTDGGRSEAIRLLDHAYQIFDDSSWAICDSEADPESNRN